MVDDNDRKESVVKFEGNPSYENVRGVASEHGRASLNPRKSSRRLTLAQAQAYVRLVDNQLWSLIFIFFIFLYTYIPFSFRGYLSYVTRDIRTFGSTIGTTIP